MRWAAPPPPPRAHSLHSTILTFSSACVSPLQVASAQSVIAAMEAHRVARPNGRVYDRLIALMCRTGRPDKAAALASRAVTEGAALSPSSVRLLSWAAGQAALAALPPATVTAVAKASGYQARVLAHVSPTSSSSYGSGARRWRGSTGGSASDGGATARDMAVIQGMEPLLSADGAFPGFAGRTALSAADAAAVLQVLQRLQGSAVAASSPAPISGSSSSSGSGSSGGAVADSAMVRLIRSVAEGSGHT